jgi:hypothetical protein
MQRQSDYKDYILLIFLLLGKNKAHGMLLFANGAVFLYFNTLKEFGCENVINALAKRCYDLQTLWGNRNPGISHRVWRHAI